MPIRRPTSRFLSLILSLLLLQTLFLNAISTSPSAEGNDDDLDGLEELLAIEEEEEQGGGTSQGKPSEAELLRKAQRIVLELSNENAKRVVDENELVMVLGYTPWCPRSAELMPRFAEASTALRDMGSPIVMVKLDAERHAKAAALLGIKGFPTILLFVNGSAQAYTGGFTGEEIIIWARKKTGAPVITISSIIAAEEFIKRHHIFVIGLFEQYEGPEYEEFLKAATTENEIQFVETTDGSVAEVLFPGIGPKKSFLGLVKNEPERFEQFEENFDKERILQFVEYRKFPLVTVLTELNSASVYSSPIKLQVYVFAQADDIKDLLSPLRNVARQYKSKIMFVSVDSAEDNLAKPFLTLFGLESEDPIVTAFDNRDGSKYLLESDLTPSNLEAFCSGLLHGTLLPYYKSEPKPDNTGIIEKVVGRTFVSSVLESAENVFLEVYTPWCIDCEATSKLIEKLAKHFKGRNDLKFGRIDASQNEHPKLQINNYPTLFFYPAGDKSNLLKISKKSSLKELVVFVKENSKIVSDRGVSPDDQAKKDEL